MKGPSADPFGHVQVTGRPQLQECIKSGRIKRDKLNGTNRFLRKSAVSCGFLRKSAVSCENLRLRNAVIPRKSESLRKSANLAPYIPFSLSLLIPPEYQIQRLSFAFAFEIQQRENRKSRTFISLFARNCFCEDCEPARPLQRSPGPFGPEIPKKSRKCLLDLPAPEPRKVSKKSWEQSGKSPENVERVFSDCS